MPTYREGGVVYIEFDTGHPDTVVNGEGGAISVQGGVTNSVATV